MRVPTRVGFDLFEWGASASGDYWSWMRDLPGYDVLSDVGGMIFAAYTGGLITPEMQKKLNNYLVDVSNKTGVPVETLTVADIQNFEALAAERQKKMFMFGGGAILIIGLLYFANKK
jgi:hypothetical protein